MSNILHLVLIPIIVTGVVQIIKFFSGFLETGKVDWKRIGEYGGMPSGHTAIVTSFAAEVGIIEGFGSTAFGIALILMIVVIRDAVGLRRHLSDQAVLIKDLAKKHLPNHETLSKIQTQIGHSGSEVLVSLVIATALTFLLHWGFKIII
ncbi:MAG: divergent PAP2 family protein [Patescibacteria group bacterium]